MDSVQKLTAGERLMVLDAICRDTDQTFREMVADARDYLAGQIENERQRINEAKRKALKQGRAFGCTPAQRTVLRQMTYMRERQGMTFEQIANYLNSNGIRTYTGKSWVRAEVSKMIRRFIGQNQQSESVAA
jgi:hypothetical protein